MIQNATAEQLAAIDELARAKIELDHALGVAAKAGLEVDLSLITREELGQHVRGLITAITVSLPRIRIG